MSEWLIDFKGRNSSYAYGVNFLWKSNNIYVMDNHRCAAWCWGQEVKPLVDYRLFHIDGHWDAASMGDENYYSQVPEGILSSSIMDYLNTERIFEKTSTVHERRLISYHNFIAAFHAAMPSAISNWTFAVHDRGDAHQPPEELNHELIYPWWLPVNLSPEKNADKKLILNLDLDYFFCDDSDQCHVRLFHPDYEREIFKAIKTLMDNDRVQVLTIALSPECCGGDLVTGWSNAETLCKIMREVLDLDFSLPI